MPEKLTILCFVRHYLPGYKSGGPVRTISNMAARLGDDFNFKILTLDRDFTERVPYPDIKRNEWNKVGKADVFYCPPRRMALPLLARFMAGVRHDILYFNSFFDPLFTIGPLLLRRLNLVPRRPVVLAARGEFSPGAVSIKAYKKSPYLAMAKLLGVYRDIIWHASSEYEAQDIKNIMGGDAWKIMVAPTPAISYNAAGGGKIVVAPDLLSAPGANFTPEWPDKAPNLLKIAFLSRISVKKNLDYALNALRQVRASVRFDIYGTREDRAYWNDCRNIMNSLGPNIAAEYKGPLPHENVYEMLQNYDLFFLPTRGENYGHVILEALTSGVPVLISDQTPWRNLREQGIGWDLPLDNPAAFARVIDDAAAMPADEHKRLRRNAWEYAQRLQRDDEALEANRRLFVFS